MKKSLGVILTLALVSMLVAGCETTDDNNIQQARACVDSAGRLDAVSPSQAEGSAGAAAACETMVVNSTTPEAGRIAFGAVLIEMGMITQIVQMSKSLQGQSSPLSGAIVAVASCPGTASSACNSTVATRLATYAAQSGSNGAMKIASFIELSQLAATVGSITNASSASSALSTLAGSPTSSTSIAAANSILTAQQQACAGSGSSSSLCQQLTSAIGSATTTQQILQNAATYVGSH